MGPCELMDLIGHDTNFAVTSSVYEANFYDKSVKFHLDYETLMSHHDELHCKRLVLTHMNAEMLARLPSLDVEAAEDGTEIAL